MIAQPSVVVLLLIVPPAPAMNEAENRRQRE